MTTLSDNLRGVIHLLVGLSDEAQSLATILRKCEHRVDSARHTIAASSLPVETKEAVEGELREVAQILFEVELTLGKRVND